jgi:hypothetical protein
MRGPKASSHHPAGVSPIPPDTGYLLPGILVTTTRPGARHLGAHGRELTYSLAVVTPVMAVFAVNVSSRSWLATDEPRAVSQHETAGSGFCP